MKSEKFPARLGTGYGEGMPAKKPVKPSASKKKSPAKQSRPGRKDFSQIALGVVERVTGDGKLKAKR